MSETNPASWLQIKELVDAALDLPAPQRAPFFDRMCAGDEALRREVESLIASCEQAECFMETPAVQSAARSLIGENKLSAGQLINHYHIVAPIGEGGMGEVYLAEDSRLGRKVALKLLPDFFTHDAARLRRFEQEARAASALSHPNVCTIHEVGETEAGRHYMVIEYVEGETLRQHMNGARMQLAEVLDVGTQIASALAAAHAEGIIHRDIKPENVMLRRDHLVKVLDFGVAKLTEPKTSGPEDLTRALEKTGAGVVIGTANYMSPEQARGLSVDARTDVWSLGVVLYEMVMGRVPFEGVTSSHVIVSILEKEPSSLSALNPEIPEALDWIVMKSLAKDREQRYQVVKDMLLDLKRLRERLSFQAELERSTQPSATSKESESFAAVRLTTSGVVEKTAKVAQALGWGSLPSAIKHPAFAAIVTLAILGFTASLLLIRNRRSPALTDKDTVLIADFVNTTGDPVFDETLKDALAVQLEQSPFLSIFPEERVRETLLLMSHSPDERVTTSVAREICERQGIKAFFTGSVTSLGRNYVIKLEAINGRTGDTLAREQVEAEGKEQVLRALGKAAAGLREKLGESVALIQKFDTPIEQATTPSLEALKAFSLGREEDSKGHLLESIPLFQRAIELDHDFALAHTALSFALVRTSQRDAGADAATKAFERRDRVTEREKYIIESAYYGSATGDLESLIESASLWARAYPRDVWPHVQLAVSYNQIGDFSKAVSEGDEAIRLDPNLRHGYSSKGRALAALNRFDEAKEVWHLAMSKAPDSRSLHDALFLLAFVQHDTSAMQQQIEWARGRSDEQYTMQLESGIALERGQLRLARELMNRAIEIAQQRNLREVPADFASLYAEHDAFIGTCRYVREDVATMLTAAHDESTLVRGAMACALCGDLARAESLAVELVKRHPKSTFGVAIMLPAARAAIEMRRGNPAKAIQLLQAADRYAPASYFWHQYLLGMAYLSEKKAAESAAEFQRIINHRGESVESSLYPLAYLGFARAVALMGDTAKSRRAYEDFFTQWKEADPDIPILIEAKKEYAKLK